MTPFEEFLAALEPGETSRLAKAHGFAAEFDGRVWASASPWAAAPPPGAAAYLAAHWPGGPEPLRALESWDVPDLVLAYACIRAEAGAVRYFTKHVLRSARPSLARLGLDAHAAEDLEQLGAQRLLTKERARCPLDNYAGKGPLRRWVRVYLVRLALKQLKRRRFEPGDGALEAELVPARLEGGLRKVQYQRASHGVVTEAIAALDDKARTLLRQHYIDGVSVATLANLHGVHRATVARWIAKSREQILGHVRARLGHHGIPAGELASAVEFVASRIVSELRRALE